MFTTPVLCVYSGIRIPNLNGIILLAKIEAKMAFRFLAPRERNISRKRESEILG